MIELTSFDEQQIKNSLIQYMKSKPQFADFNYEGSTINTLIDLLSRNSLYDAYLANMAANESFLDSAQSRGNVVSHAEKLSYNPKSKTAATIQVNVKVVPSSPSAKTSINCKKGSIFLSSVGGVSYSFTNPTEFSLFKNPMDGNFYATGVELKQGQLISQKALNFQAEGKIEILNKDIDTSTLKVFVRSSTTDLNRREFIKVDDITSIKRDSSVFYLSESTYGTHFIEFGKNILGEEPTTNSVIEYEYIIAENQHGNGVSTLVSGGAIEGLADVQVTVTIPAYGGSDKDSIERIRFLAPRIYKAQNRAVVSGDYEALTLEKFPFIKSCISWGGDENDPPYYGKTYLSGIPQEGFIIADSVKRSIETSLKRYSSTTPIMVDPVYINIDLKVGFIFNESKTSMSFNDVASSISQTVNRYSQDILLNFDLWYNNSLLSSMLTEIPGVESVELDKVAYQDVKVSQGTKAKYNIDFVNVLKKGTLASSQFITDVNASSERMYDDELGGVFIEVTKLGVSTSNKIGTVDYATGKIEFVATFLDGFSNLKLYAEPDSDNVYTKRNYVTRINSVDTYRIRNARD